MRAALEDAGYDPRRPRPALFINGSEGQFAREVLGRSQIDERTYSAAIAIQITTRQRWRAEHEAAKGGAGPPGVVAYISKLEGR